MNNNKQKNQEIKKCGNNKKIDMKKSVKKYEKKAWKQKQKRSVGRDACRPRPP